MVFTCPRILDIVFSMFSLARDAGEENKESNARRFEFVAQKAQRTANMEHTEVFRTWVRLEVFCCFGQEVKHRLVGHLDFLKKGYS